MTYSRSDISNIVDEIVEQYRGQRISYFGSFLGDARVPVLYYVDKLRDTSPAPAMYNNRLDGWGIEFPIGLMSLFTHEEYQTDKAYPKGTILIWNTPHIAIVVSSDGTNTVKVLEQNAELDGKPCGVRDRTVNGQRRICTYALVPIFSDQEPIRQIVIRPAPSPHPYKPPMAPLKLPVKERKIYIRNPVPGFSAYTRATKHDGSIAMVPTGNYYIYRELGGMLNIHKDRNTPGYWIDPADIQSM